MKNRLLTKDLSNIKKWGNYKKNICKYDSAQMYLQITILNLETVMNDNKKQLEEWSNIDCDAVDFDELESRLESELEEQMADLAGLEQDAGRIGNPDTLGETVINVVWEQFINQVGVFAGEDFIKENRGLTLDLRDSAHIQTTENFANG
jgi:hypothetical protein